MKNIRAAVVGATGYTDSELVRILAQHPAAELVAVISEQRAGEPFLDVHRHFLNIVDLVVTHPDGYELSERFMQDTRLEYDQAAAFEGAHFIYAKNWSNYRDYGSILRTDAEWMVTASKMANTVDARFLHCLPVRRNVVVEDAVLDSPASAVIQQAGNRIWSAQAVLKRMLEAL